MGRKSLIRKEMRRGKAHWVIDIRYGKQRFRRDAKVQTRQAAEAEAERRWLCLLNDGTILLPEERPRVATTVGDFLTQHFEPVYMPVAFSPGSRAAYKSHLKDIVAHYGSLRFENITQADHHRFAKRLLERKITTRKHLALLRTILRQAVETDYVNKLPPLPTLPKQPKRTASLPTNDTVAALIRAASGYVQVAVVLGAVVGLRKSEARALRVGDVDLHRDGRPCVHVRRTFSGSALKAPKSGDERRVWLYSEIFGERAVQILDAACADREPGEHVLRTPIGSVPCGRSIDDALGRLQRKLAVPKFRFHLLRHWNGTTLLRRGVNPEVVRRLLGHEDPRTTMGYLHLEDGDFDLPPGVMPVLAPNHRSADDLGN